ncbi:MAG: phospholipase D family protein [Desulfococcaceae bacterium]
MAKFLDTTGISYHLQQLINNANEKLILISPFLKINERIRQSLEDKDRLKIDIRIIYGKNELQPDENNWLKSLQSVRSSFCKNLHAKCYMNENEAIITSMNLYEFSQVNNNEMGIYVSKTEDSEMYQDIYNETMRLLRISDEIRVSVEKIIYSEKDNKISEIPSDTGYCIRCKKNIVLNASQPYCTECFKVWNQFKNRNYKETCCHVCGKENASTISKPICYDCYKQNKYKNETGKKSG